MILFRQEKELMMKRIFYLLSVIVFGLSSCGGVSSSSTGQSSSASDSSTSSTSLTSSSSSITPVTYPLVVSYVTKRASKYNNGLTAENIMSKAGLNLSSPSNKGTLVRTLKAAFDGFMPELKGQRKYGGVYTMPTIDGTISNEAEAALEWMVTYGLWNDSETIKDENGKTTVVEKAFAEEATVDEAYIETLLKRFYVYFGTEESDDFFASTNHDFLYEGTDDANVKPDVNYQNSLLLDSATVQTNVLSFTETLANSRDKDAALFQEALDYYNGTLDYTFGDDSLVMEQITSIESISNISDWLTYSATSFSTFGQGNLCYINSPSFSYDKNFNIVTSIRVESDTVDDSYLYEETYPEEKIISIATNAYKVLGLSDSDVSSLSQSFSSFESKYWTEYQNSKYENIRGTNEFLYDSDTKKDIYAVNGINIDMTSIFTSAGYTLGDLTVLSTKDTASYLAYGNTLVTATTEELKALAFYELYSANNSAILYSKNTPGTYKVFLSMIQNNLADAYMKSAYYKDSLDTMTDLFNGIKRVFKKRLGTRSWLSDEGKATLEEKIDAMKSTLMGTSSDGTTLDYPVCLRHLD